MLPDTSADDGRNYLGDFSIDLFDEGSGRSPKSGGYPCCLFLNSSLSVGQYAKALAYAREGRYKIIYVAPERLETQGVSGFCDVGRH